jgi:hypothetical protein
MSVSVFYLDQAAGFPDQSEATSDKIQNTNQIKHDIYINNKACPNQ